jgi:hypothetical protein
VEGEGFEVTTNYLDLSKKCVQVTTDTPAYAPVRVGWIPESAKWPLSGHRPGMERLNVIWICWIRGPEHSPNNSALAMQRIR